MLRVCILSQQADHYLQQLAAAFPQVEWHSCHEPARLSAQAKQAQVLLAEPALAAAVLDDFPQLDWCHSMFAGVDTLLAAARRDYQLTNSRGMFGPLMSEYVFSYLLAHVRCHQQYREQQQQSQWQVLPNASLQNKQFCCIGSGSIASHLAQTARSFGMQTHALNRSGKAGPEFDSVEQLSPSAPALSQADVVVSVLPNSPATMGIIDKAYFARMKAEVMFFNVGRGATVVAEDLLAFLAQHEKAQAVLDVFEQEPLPENSALWQIPNLIITPHVSAPSRVEDIAKLFSENLALYLNAKPLKYVVDFERGY